MTLSAERTLSRLETAVERAAERLPSLQHPRGYWVAALASKVTMTAQHLFWNRFLGLRDAARDRRLANELLPRRRDDGSWSIWFEGPPDLSTSIEAYVALKLAGVDPGERSR